MGLKALKGHGCLLGPREPFKREIAYLADGTTAEWVGFLDTSSKSDTACSFNCTPKKKGTHVWFPSVKE